MWDFFFLIKWGWDGIWEEEKKGEKGGGGLEGSKLLKKSRYFLIVYFP